MNRRQLLSIVYILIVLLLPILLVFPSIKNAVILNRSTNKILSAIMLSNDAARFWYAADLPAVTGDKLNTLLINTFNFWPVKGVCTEHEKSIWQGFPIPLSLPQNGHSNEALQVLLQARSLECDGRLSEAADILEKNKKNTVIYLKMIDLQQRMGQSEIALSNVVNSVCPPNAEWCKWCMAKAMQIDINSDSETKLVSNGSPEDQLLINMVTIAPLEKIGAPSVKIETELPLVVTGIVSVGNYIEYGKISILSSKVRFRVWGVVMGGNISSQISPYLVFWDTGKYNGETALEYNVTGKFIVDYWVDLPNNTTEVSPRIIFNPLSFTGGQYIAICNTELAIVP